MSTVRIPEYVVAMEVYEESGIAFGDFTDGGAAAGTYTCKFTLPAGFFIQRCVLTDVTGFTGDTSAVITIGDGTDVDRLNAGTPSVYATATALDMGAPSGVTAIVTAFAPVLTITSASDWGAVEAGVLTIKVHGFMVR